MVQSRWQNSHIFFIFTQIVTVKSSVFAVHLHSWTVTEVLAPFPMDKVITVSLANDQVYTAEVADEEEFQSLIKASLATW